MDRSLFLSRDIDKNKKVYIEKMKDIVHSVNSKHNFFIGILLVIKMQNICGLLRVLYATV